MLTETETAAGVAGGALSARDASAPTASAAPNRTVAAAIVPAMSRGFDMPFLLAVRCRKEYAAGARSVHRAKCFRTAPLGHYKTRGLEPQKRRTHGQHTLDRHLDSLRALADRARRPYRRVADQHLDRRGHHRRALQPVRQSAYHPMIR